MARAGALRRRIRDRQRRGFAGHHRRDRDARLSGPRRPRQRGRDLRHERRPTADDRDAAPVLVQIGWRCGVRLDRRRASRAAAAVVRVAGARRRRGPARRRARAVAARGGAQAAVLAAARDLRDLRARRFLRHHACGGVRAGQRPRRAVRRQPAGADGPDRTRRRDRVGSRERPLRPGRGRRRSRSSARIIVFAWIAVDQSPLSITVFALVFGATFLVTAPLTVVFVRESFGTKNLGALAG